MENPARISDFVPINLLSRLGSKPWTHRFKDLPHALRIIRPRIDLIKIKTRRLPILMKGNGEVWLPALLEPQRVRCNLGRALQPVIPVQIDAVSIFTLIDRKSRRIEEGTNRPTHLTGKKALA